MPAAARPDADHGRCVHRHRRTRPERREGETAREQVTPRRDADSPLANVSPAPTRPPFAKLLRIWTLVRKEYLQIIRDPSSIGIGVVMPVMLILLFGHGLSLDVKDVPVAIVMEQPSPDAMELAARFQLSPYFDARLMTSMKEAEDADAGPRRGRHRPHSFGLRPGTGLGATPVQILVHGTDANRARIIQGYAQGAVGQWVALRQAPGEPSSPGRSACAIGCGSTRPTTAIISSCPDWSCWS